MGTSAHAIGKPGRGEAAEYYFKYIDKVTGHDPVAFLESQLRDVLASLETISEEDSLFRYAPDKWSLRQVLSHVNDSERVFTYRALWFARGFETPLPSFDQDTAVASAGADEVPWTSHLEEFRGIRQASIHLFSNLPDQAWMRRGIASDNPVTVRALAYIVGGHAAHHMAIIRERYS
jgi:DinB superfamily